MMSSRATNSGNQTANPYERYDQPQDGDDLIDPDDGKHPPNLIPAPENPLTSTLNQLP